MLEAGEERLDEADPAALEALAGRLEAALDELAPEHYRAVPAPLLTAPFGPGRYRYTVFTKGSIAPGDLARLLARLGRAGLIPFRAAVAGGSYLAATGVMRRHYAVMEEATREGPAGFAPGARQTAAGLDPPLTAANWIGGYALAAALKLDGALLNEHWERWFKWTVRVGPGTRVLDLARYPLEGGRAPARARYLVNGHMPYFMGAFEAPAFRLAVLEVEGRLAPRPFREEVIGDQGQPGSLRAELPALNCHGSAGVIEAMLESANLAGGPPPLEQPYAAELERLGLTRSRLALFLENPEIRYRRSGGEGRGSVFDATEKLDLAATAAVLKEAEPVR